MSETKKEVHRTRPNMVAIRMTDEELSEFQKKMKEAGMSMQSYILGSLYGSTVSKPEGITELKALSKDFDEASRQFRGVSLPVIRKQNPESCSHRF